MNKQKYIPKNIFICHKNYNNACINVNKWKLLNPTYKIFIFDNADCINFLRKEYPEIMVDIYNFIKDGPIKSDFFRLCILYSKGGIYADSDIIPLVGIDNFADFSADLITCYIEENEKSLIYAGKNINYNPHFIIAKQSDPFIRECLEKYIYMYLNKINYNYLSWSITRIFPKVINFIPHYKQIYEHFIKGTFLYKIQLLNNVYENGYNDEHSVFNNMRILKNRDNLYDALSHQFCKVNKQLIFVDISKFVTNLDHDKINNMIVGASEMQYYKLIESLSNFYDKITCYNIRDNNTLIDNVYYKKLDEIIYDSIDNVHIVLNRFIPNINSDIYNKIKCSKMFIWCHDLPHYSVFGYDYNTYDETNVLNATVNNPNINFVFVSNFCKNKYNEYFKNLNIVLDDDRQFVIYNILYDNLLYKKNYEKNKYMITYASAWNKGLYKMLEIFEKLLKIDNNYRLHLMTPGYESEQFKHIESYISSKFGDKIILHGKCDKKEYSKIISKSICVFAPKFHETFGCVFAESYYLGTNVIFDIDSGAVNEIVDSYYCCDYSNVESIYNKIKDISINDQNIILEPKFMYKNIISQILKMLG